MIYIFILTGFVDRVSSSRLRLTPSRFPGLNLVEVYHNGQWGTVCPNVFYLYGYRIGQVVCRQLGYGNLTSATNAWMLRNTTYDAHANQKVWLVIDVCNGAESDIDTCVHRPWGAIATNHIYDILVKCSSCECHKMFVIICVALFCLLVTNQYVYTT